VKLRSSANWILIFVPIAFVWPFGFNTHPTALFIVSAIAIIPLAGWMGRSTEALAGRMGEGVGGLLNATL